MSSVVTKRGGQRRPGQRIEKPAPVITVEQVTRYAELSAEIGILEDRKAKLRAELIEAHKAGAKSPADGQFALTFVDQARTVIAWKDEAESLARRFMNLGQIEKWLVDVLNRAEITPVTQVKVKVRKQTMLETARSASPAVTSAA